MKIELKGFFLFFILHSLALTLIAQEKEPLISGKVTVSIENGTFECDLTLSDIPHIRDYVIRLNSGMNILNFRSKEPNDFLLTYYKTDSLSTWESIAYYFPDNTGKDKFLPKSLQIKYVGKFPVVRDTLDNNYAVQDWKGNIAFNGYSLRTDGFQTAWYPILYDVEKDKRYSSVRYDVEVICEDCNSLYLNGSKPFNGRKTTFKSNDPRDLTMYLGKYKISNIGGTYFLNLSIDKEQIKELGNFTNTYKKYYESRLGIPYSQEITYINTTPVSKRNAWMFVSYPTIVNIGHGKYGLKEIFDGEFKNYFRYSMAHELAHFYFGSYKTFNSVLGDMMSEGFSEYLALNLSEDLIDKEIFQAKLNQKFELLNDFKAIPFAYVKSNTDYIDREAYVYNYAPIIFKAIENEIGKQKMWQWLRNILQTQSDFTDYDFLTVTLKRTLKNEKLFNLIKNKYFQNENSAQNAINKIKGERIIISIN